MYPAVSLPSNSKIARPVEVKLKAGWRFDRRRRAFVAESGAKCTSQGDLPRKTKVVAKVPSLTEAPEAALSAPQKELRRYVQIILPEGHSPEEHLDAIRRWPCVEDAQLPPVVSLPTVGHPGPSPG